jgi:hypothetical protein
VDFTAKGGNKIVDEKGEPLTVFHGSEHEFTEFKPKSLGTYGEHAYYYFAKAKSWVEKFAKEEPVNKDKFKIKKFNLSIKNPLDIRDQVLTVDEWIKYFESKGIFRKLEPAGERESIFEIDLQQLDRESMEALNTDVFGGVMKIVVHEECHQSINTERRNGIKNSVKRKKPKEQRKNRASWRLHFGNQFLFIHSIWNLIEPTADENWCRKYCEQEENRVNIELTKQKRKSNHTDTFPGEH